MWDVNHTSVSLLTFISRAAVSSLSTLYPAVLPPEAKKTSNLQLYTANQLGSNIITVVVFTWMRILQQKQNDWLF